MLSLKTGGFADLVADVVTRARAVPDAAAAVRTALTLDGRLGEEVGARALTTADRLVVDAVLDSGVRLDPDGDDGDRLYLTRTGRLAVRLEHTDAPERAYLLGVLRWGGQNPTDLRTRWYCERDETAKRISAVRDELALEPVERVHARLDRIEYALVHMAPVQIYVNDRLYTNLGKASTLPGKSLAVGDERSVLTGLRRTPVAAWAPEDACFVACLDVLLSSGPSVRAEEFNGAQLNPGTLGRFLVERVAGYGGAAPLGQPPTSLAELAVLAGTCADARARVLAEGLLPYRVINGLNLYKREQLMVAPAVLADAPDGLRAHLAGLLGTDLPPDTRIDALAPAFAALVGRLVSEPAPDGFGSAFQAVLHGLLTATAEAFGADVAMSRGPQRFDPLRVEPGVDPFGLGTGDFYCCVTPRRAFVERFGEDRAGLVRTLSAYSARMRFNTWHYLPSTLGIVEREPGRDDWFFAPTMPDLTDWSDQHHTGHVAFGVRHAIRVPFGVEFDGRFLPGLYDLRLMRTTRPPFTLADLRAAVATAWLLRALYQSASAYEPVVTDFEKTWYERFHG